MQAVLDNNLVVVQLLLRHGAQIDQKVNLVGLMMVMMIVEIRKFFKS